MTKTYTLTITEEQAKVIEHSTELLSRIMGGQWREVLDWLPLHKEMDWEEYHNDVNIMTAILSKHMIDGIDGWSSSFGVGSLELNHLPRWKELIVDQTIKRLLMLCKNLLIFGMRNE